RRHTTFSRDWSSDVCSSDLSSTERSAVMTDQNTAAPVAGRDGAVVAWILYILSIPSANVLVLVGLVLAYVNRGSATGLAAQHVEAQIKLFWSVFWISAILWVLVAISAVASAFLIGIPFLLLFGLLLLLVSIWLTVISALGLLALFNDRPACSDPFRRNLRVRLQRPRRRPPFP